MRRLTLAPFLFALAVTLSGHAARADARPLDDADMARLERGETVVREQTYASDEDERRLVGGIAYAMLDAAPETVLALLEDDQSFSQILPKTKRTRRLDGDADDQRVEITQGNGVVSATYVLHVRKYARENTVRFWLDPEFPHAIDDAWGYVRVTPVPTASGAPRCLVTYGALVDLGPGIVRALYEERLRAAMLSVPQLLRAYVARHARPQSPHV